MEIASRAPALSLPGERTAWLFFGACAFAALLLLLPFSRAPYPAMPDYPNHLARAEIIVDAELHGREHPYYAVRHALIPNLALDSFVLGAAKLGLATNDALRLFAAAALLLPIGGVIAIGFALQRTVPWLALLAFPLAYSRYYVWGFLNYFFAIGLAFFGFAAWLSLRRSRTALGALVLALFGIGALLSHLAGFAVLGILVACHELGESRRLTASAMAALAAIGACAGAYVVFFAHDLPLTLAWQDGVLIRLRNLAAPFVAYDVAPGALLAASALAVIVLARRQGALRMQRGWALPLGALAVLCIALPSMAMNSYYVAARLYIVPALLFLAYAALKCGRRGQLALALAMLVLVSLKVAEVDAHWRRFSDDVARYRDALQALPRGARIATVVYATHAGIVPARHVAAFAVMDRDAFIPNFYGFPYNGESVAFRSEVAPLPALTGKDHLVFDPAGEAPPWPVFCESYDALLVLRFDERAHPPPSCAAPVHSEHDFTLYRLSRPAGAR